MIAERLGPIARSTIVSGLLLIALFFGLAGGLYGFEFQILLVLVLVPAALLVLNERIAVALLVVMLPYSNSTLWFLPRILQNAVIVGIPALFFARMALRVAAGKGLPFVPPREVFFYIAVMCVGVAIGMTHLREINPLVMATIAEDGSFGFREYVIGFFVKQMMLVVMALMVAAAVAERGRAEWVLILAFGSGVLFVAAMLGVLVAFGVPLSELRSNRNVFFVLGRQSNQLGGLLVFLLAVALFVRETVTGVRRRSAMLLVIFALVLGVMLTASRGAFLALMVVFLVYVLKFRRIRTAFAAIVIFVAGLMAAPESVHERLVQGLDSRIMSSGISTTAGDRLSSGRFDIWMQVAPEILLHPIFGNGLRSTLWSNYNRYGRNIVVNHPHSGYLELLLDHGLVGLICAFVLFRYAWKMFGSLAKDPRVVGGMRGAFMAGPALILAMLAFAVANGHFYPSTDQVYFWLFLGLGMGYQRWLSAQPTAVAAPSIAGHRSFHTKGYASNLKPRA